MLIVYNFCPPPKQKENHKKTIHCNISCLYNRCGSNDVYVLYFKKSSFLLFTNKTNVWRKMLSLQCLTHLLTLFIIYSRVSKTVCKITSVTAVLYNKV